VSSENPIRFIYLISKISKALLRANKLSNSHYETNFGVSSACGAGNPKIGFLKASHRMAFKKPILIMRIAEINPALKCWLKAKVQ
jgi:hypothetical protein